MPVMSRMMIRVVRWRWVVEKLGKALRMRSTAFPIIGISGLLGGSIVGVGLGVAVAGVLVWTWGWASESE